MNLSNINLNLLLALHWLLEERHVTRAGERMSISQSAMSNHLKQLRDIFNDPLFVRGQSSTMIPTAEAQRLQAPLKEWVQQLNQVLYSDGDYNPAQDQRTFYLGMSDYSQFVILPKLIAYLQHHAPGVKLNVMSLDYIESQLMFERKNLDLAIGVFPHIPGGLIADLIFEDSVVCVGCEKNEVLKKPLLFETFLETPQIVILYYQSISDSLFQRTLDAKGLNRNIAYVVSNTLSALYALPNTLLLATVRSGVANEILTKLPLITQPAPFDYPPSEINQVWHPKNRNDPGHRWLRTVIKDLFH